MKLTMRSTYASPDRLVHPGQTLDVGEAEARDLIAGRYALPADPASDRVARQIEAEAAEAAIAEAAEGPDGKRRKPAN